jgi:protein-S-isoprenylcysteine O-methyltransferase Ste14
MRRDIPPIHFLGGIVLAATVRFALPQANLIPLPWNWLGALIVVWDGYLNVRAAKVSEHRGTPHILDRSTAVVEEGPFRWTRNPMYLGMTSILAGIAVCLGNFAALLAPALFLAIIQLKFIPLEERKMEEELGEAYLQCRRRVRRWL